MEFICIIIVLAIMYTSQFDTVLHRDAWFTRWHQLLSNFPLPPKAALLLALAVPVLAILGLHWWVGGRFYGLAELALMLLVLLYCIGRAEYSEAYARYRRALRCGDIQGAYRALDFIQPDGASNFAEMHRSVEQRLLHERFDYSFVPIFWFFIAGPAGALLYRLMWLARDSHLSIAQADSSSEQESDAEHGATANGVTAVMREEERALAPPDTLAFGSRWLAWLEWLPARLLGFAFALVGDFNRTIARIADTFLGSEPTRIAIRHWALAALGEASDEAGSSDVQHGVQGANQVDESATSVATDAVVEHSLQRMIDLARLMRRSLIVWVVAIAIGLLLI